MALAFRTFSRPITDNNQNVGGNIIDRIEQQYIVRGIGLIRSEADIGDIVLRPQDGRRSSSGRRRSRNRPRRPPGRCREERRGEAVGGIVMMLKGENSRDVVEAGARQGRGDQCERILPAGIRIVPFYERSEIVGKSIHTVVKTLAEGAILVVVVLYLFLRSLRGALIVILALPLVALLTFIVMKSRACRPT